MQWPFPCPSFHSTNNYSVFNTIHDEVLEPANVLLISVCIPKCINIYSYMYLCIYTYIYTQTHCMFGFAFCLSMKY